jgi:hypothetical protein
MGTIVKHQSMTLRDYPTLEQTHKRGTARRSCLIVAVIAWAVIGRGFVCLEQPGPCRLVMRYTGV